MVLNCGWVRAIALISFLSGWAGAVAQQPATGAQQPATATQQPATATQPTAASLGIDPIMAYAGVWKIETDHFDTEFSKMSHESSSLKNVCWKSGGYVACNQMVNGESKVLLVFTYVEKQNSYTTYQIPQGGGEPGSGKLFIDGNTWEFPWRVTGDKITYFRVVNVFVAPDRIEYRQEYSADKEHWTVMAKGTERKISAE
jgi:hypothetical protein